MYEQISPVYLHTVTGLVDPSSVSIADGHTHVWIDDVGAVDPNPMILNNMRAIVQELLVFCSSGGQLMVDCQPGGCGRDGNMLREISQKTGVAITAATGFHLRRYYPYAAPIFDMDVETAYRYFISELTGGLAEAPHVKAGIIKIACEDTLDKSPRTLIEAAVLASVDTGSAIEVHTERGQDAVNIMRVMLNLGMSPGKLILCHLDKSADLEMHREIAESGVMLEYDTFLRPRYHPDENVWPLLFDMIEAGYEDHLILATDLADARMWHYIGGGPGAVAFIDQIKAKLIVAELPESTILKLVGSNLVRSIAF